MYTQRTGWPAAHLGNDERSRLELVKAGVGASLLLNVESESSINAGEISAWQQGITHTDLQLAWLTEREEDPLIVPALNALKSSWETVPDL